MNIGDIFIAIGMLWFLLAEFRQLRKIFRKNNVAGLSLTHYNWKMIAIISAMIGYTILNLPYSFMVITTECIITIVIISIIRKKRRINLRQYLREWI